MGGHSHIDGQQHHDTAGDLGEFIHQAAGFLAQEDENGDGRTDQSPGNGSDAEQHIQPQPGAAQVPDVEGQAPEYHESRNQVAQPGQDHVGDILPRFFGHGDDTPYIQLGNGIDDDHGQDGKAETGSQLPGKYRRLGQKTRSDGRGGHQERSTQQYAHIGFFLHHNLPLIWILFWIWNCL